MNVPQRAAGAASSNREDRGPVRVPEQTARPGCRIPVFHQGTAADGRALRIEVVSAQPIIRAGILALLQTQAKDVVLVAHAPGEWTRPAAAEPSVDAVIYDVIGFHLDDGRDLALLTRTYPGLVLALGRELQPGLAERALALGAVAVIPLGADAAGMLATVRALASGHLCDGSVTALPIGGPGPRDLGRGVRLTPRERDVLALIVAGSSNTDIADELFLSINTVKSFIRSAYAKIGATTRAQAAAWGVEHGFPTTRTDRRPARVR